MATLLTQMQRSEEEVDMERKSQSQLKSQEQVEEIERLTFKICQMDTNSDNKISFDEFFTAVQTEPTILNCFSLTTNLLDDKFRSTQVMLNIRNKGIETTQNNSKQICIVL